MLGLFGFSRGGAGCCALSLFHVDERAFGLRSQYSVMFAVGGQREPSPREAAHRLLGPVAGEDPRYGVLLRNGGWLRLDMAGLPEYATPECGGPLDLIVHDKAGERIMEGLLADASQRLRDEGSAGDIRVFKRSAGPADSSPEFHEEYLVSRNCERFRLVGILIPFLVTRQLTCGAGAVVPAPLGTVYCLSREPEPGHTGNGPPGAVGRSRPHILRAVNDARDAVRARLMVSVSDSAMSEATTLLRAGATDLVLRMAESGTVLPDLVLDNPRRAIAEVSRDITGRSLLRLARGRQVSALDIQREYLAKAKDFTSSRGADAVSTRVLGLWERTLDAIEAGNPGAIAREIDWAIKYQLIQQHRAEHDLPLSAPEITQVDLGYHDIRRSHGLYYQLQRSGAVERTARDIDIFEAKTVPPAPGRYGQAG
jgi:proteasome accessory factor A